MEPGTTGKLSGRAQPVIGTYNGMRSGATNVTVLQIPLTSQLPCFEVLLQADPDNTDDVFVGEAVGDCRIQMEPGDVMVVPINDASKILIRAAAGAQTINWLAMR